MMIKTIIFSFIHLLISLFDYLYVAQISIHAPGFINRCKISAHELTAKAVNETIFYLFTFFWCLIK